MSATLILVFACIGVLLTPAVVMWAIEWLLNFGHRPTVAMGRWCTVEDRVTFPVDEIVQLFVFRDEKKPRIEVTFKPNSDSEALGTPFHISFVAGSSEQWVHEVRNGIVAAMVAWDESQRVYRPS